jgi:hypothetical protein
MGGGGGGGKLEIVLWPTPTLLVKWCGHVSAFHMFLKFKKNNYAVVDKSCLIHCDDILSLIP